MKQNIIRHRRQTGFAALLVSTSLASTLSLAAQDFGGYEGLESSTVEGGFKVSVAGAYRTEADIDGGGDFSEGRFSVMGLGIIKLNEQWTVNPVFSYRLSLYDFSGTDPWDDIHTLRTTPLVQYNLDDHWTIFGGPSVGFSAESDADIGNAFTFGAVVGVRYKISPNVTIGGGLGVFSQIEDDATILPLFTLNWQIADQLNLRAGFSEVAAAGGLGAELEWKFDEHWSVGAGAQLQTKRFRLSDDSGAPVRDGVGEDTSVPIYGKVTWHASKHASVELVAGVAVGGEVRLEDDDGHKIAEEDYDPAGLFGIRALFSF